jgi:hypothetical protein
MNDDDKKLLIETLAEMKELKGALTEFKVHVISRVSRLEKRESEQAKNFLTAISLVISTLALGISIIVNFFKGGGVGR